VHRSDGVGPRPALVPLRPSVADLAVYDRLNAGDIIALVTNIEGLDVTHTGLVYDDGNGGKGLLHASTSGGVIVSPDLQRYVTNNRRQIGILVARPQPASGRFLIPSSTP
jgi:hypothetical protein